MTAWPPPPDLASTKALMHDADIEGLIEIHGAPADEYDSEAESLHAAIMDLPTAEITARQTDAAARSNLAEKLHRR